ncbi:MAG: hypothetical protein KF752_17095 [Pirellulaceae bacterium]|nr:hypothetical protein [Pirellulaceae bacterium]
MPFRPHIFEAFKTPPAMVRTLSAGARWPLAAWAGAWGLAVLAALPGNAQEAAPEAILRTSPAALATSDATTQRLVDQQHVQRLMESLGDTSFEVRERAASELLRKGSVALAVLQRLPLSEMSLLSKEARQRTLSIRSELEKHQFVTAAHAFLLDVDDQVDHGLPAWKVYRDVVGSSPTSKLLYLEMLKTQYQLAQQVDLVYRTVSEDGDATSPRRELVQQMTAQAEQLIPRMYRGAGVSIGDSAALMLGLSMLEHTAPVEVSQLIHSTAQLNFFGYLVRPGYRLCLQRLLACWIPRAHDALAPEVMRIAFEQDIHNVLPIARRHLSNRYDKMTRERAMLCLAKFGERSDVPALLALIEDATVVYEFDEIRGDITKSSDPPPGLAQEPAVQTGKQVIRINDIAAATAMILLQQNPQQLFPAFSKDAFFIRSLAPLAVESTAIEDRDRAIQAWAASLDISAAES